MDPDIKQLQDEIKRLGAITADTNRIVHGMRRSQRWHTFVSLVWWATILGVTAASYWYAWPYIQQAQKAYQSFQSESQKASSLQQQIQDALGQYLGQTKAQ